MWGIMGVIKDDIFAIVRQCRDLITAPPAKSREAQIGFPVKPNIKILDFGLYIMVISIFCPNATFFYFPEWGPAMPEHNRSRWGNGCEKPPHYE